MKLLQWLMAACETVGGSREPASPGQPRPWSFWLCGLWWGVLAGAIMLFCGQTSKFIYIDF